MSGPLKLRSQWLALGCSILVAVAVLSACESLPEGLSQSAAPVASSEAPGPDDASAAEQSAAKQEAFAEVNTTSDALEIKHFVDISGCWRPVGASLVYSDGASFTIFAIANNTFIIGKDARTSFVVRENLGFVEGNRDAEKPFYPPGYIHSTGAVSKDGMAISRSFPGQPGAKEYRRCANVQQAPPGLRVPIDPNSSEETPGSPGATPSPQGTIAPLISRLNPSPSPAQTPPPPVQPEPSLEPTPEASAP